MSVEYTPQSIAPGSVIGAALRIYRDNAAVLLAGAAVVFGIEALVSYAFHDALFALAAIIALVATTFYQGMVVELVRDVQDGRRDSGVGDLFRGVTPVVLPLIVVSILAGLGIGLGFVLLIVPGLFLLTIWSVVAPVTVLERPGILAAFGRSRELVRGYGWNVFGVMIVALLVTFVVSLIGEGLVSSLGDEGEAVGRWVVSVLTAPFTALLAAVLYFGLRRAHGEPRDAVTWPSGPEVPAWPAREG
jgi:uncharacterized membrane protein